MLRLQQKNILDLVKEVKAQRILYGKKDKHIFYLKGRRQSQYTRMNRVIVIGLSIIGRVGRLVTKRKTVQSRLLHFILPQDKTQNLTSSLCDTGE